MKIYKLDIDTSKPIRQIAQMQQNSEGVLSVNVSNDGKYIRNLSCAMYEDGNEVSAIAEGDDSFGYKLAVGETPHVVKITAKSTPITCLRQYIASESGANRTKPVQLNVVQIPAGVYNQDEFYNLTNYFGGQNLADILVVSADCLSNANFNVIYVTPWNTTTPVQFRSSETSAVMDINTPISATGDVYLYKQVYARKATVTLSAVEYPAIGYWTDYSLDTVIKPSTNAACYAEADIQEPTPEPDPEPTPDPEEPVEPTEG